MNNLRFKDLNEVLKYFYQYLDDKSKQLLKNNHPITFHLSSGMNIRNFLGLWEENNLTTWFKSVGIFHPDDMSNIILTSLKRKLLNQDIDLDNQIKYIENYLKNKDSIESIYFKKSTRKEYV